MFHVAAERCNTPRLRLARRQRSLCGSPALCERIIDEQRPADDIPGGHEAPESSVKAVARVVPEREVGMIRNSDCFALEKLAEARVQIGGRVQISVVREDAARVQVKCPGTRDRGSVSVYHGLPDLYPVAGNPDQPLDEILVPVAPNDLRDVV